MTSNTGPSPLAPISNARNELWLPPPAMASCIRAIMMRDTAGITLSDEQRYNRFPVNPGCILLWTLSGEFQLLVAGDQEDRSRARSSVPALSLWAPSTRPHSAWNPGECHSFALVLLPDAFAALTGITPLDYLNRVVTLEGLLDEAWLDWCRAMQQAADDKARIELVLGFLQPRWQQHKQRNKSENWILKDWVQYLTTHAATSSLGKSVRQVERRIKSWTGRPLRELRGIGRAEQVLFELAISSLEENTNWSDIASKSGYADQSHLCRQVKALTGYSPEALRSHIISHEAFWPYRMWGFCHQHQRHYRQQTSQDALPEQAGRR